MRRALGLVSAVAAVVLGGSACANQTAGTAVAVPGEHPAPAGPEVTGSSGAPELSQLQPCDLLADAASKSLGIAAAGKPGRTADSRSCEWKVDKGTVADSYTITAEVWRDRGLDRITTERPVEYLKVGAHEAAQFIAGGGKGCAVALAVGDDTRVDVRAAGEKVAEELCESALAAAKLVEPVIP
ncbi:DUF3558 family protein [Actinokineospora auranticolor]|uniref:Uncharacterized protein DUF3558 n=1 Tax=Actinokineospora auranticolor TaxID=155976 RepID=A0A2S6GRG2_9PSEU|nr:DUF3558 family protein [Actinokineospora auranticolor]PPK67786.1 uncharacterized protein DUF3558 [Actinokineospora auranticolor]